MASTSFGREPDDPSAVTKPRKADASITNLPSFERRHRSSSASYSPLTSIPMTLTDQAASPNAAARFV
jgi:hypothetical protein